MLFNGEPVDLPENWSNMIVFLGYANNYCAGKILNSLEFSMLDLEVLLQTEEQCKRFLKMHW